MSIFDTKAFGESWTAWIGRVTQQIKDIELKLERLQAGIISMDDDIRTLSTSLATLTVVVNNLSAQVQTLSNRVEQIDARNASAIASGVEMVNQAEKIKKLEDNQAWVIRGIFLLLIAAAVNALLSFSRIEYQLQHPSAPRSEAPVKLPSSKL